MVNLPVPLKQLPHTTNTGALNHQAVLPCGAQFRDSAFCDISHDISKGTEHFPLPFEDYSLFIWCQSSLLAQCHSCSPWLGLAWFGTLTIWFDTCTAFSRHRRVSSSVANVGSAAFCSPSSLLPNNSYIRLHVQKKKSITGVGGLKSIYIYELTKQRRCDDIPVRRYQHPGQQQDARAEGAAAPLVAGGGITFQVQRRKQGPHLKNTAIQTTQILYVYLNYYHFIFLYVHAKSEKSKNYNFIAWNIVICL